MMIKLHYRDVCALLTLLEDIELESDEERHAMRRLQLMKQVMEEAYQSSPKPHKISNDTRIIIKSNQENFS